MTTPDPTPAPPAGPWRDRWKFAAKYERERANEAERNMMQTHARSMEWLAQKDALIREILEADEAVYAERDALARDLAAALAERDEAQRAAANNAAWGQAWEADALTAQAALERASMGLYVASHENISGEAATAIEGVRSEIRAALARLGAGVDGGGRGEGVRWG